MRAEGEWVDGLVFMNLAGGFPVLDSFRSNLTTGAQQDDASRFRLAISTKLKHTPILR